MPAMVANRILAASNGVYLQRNSPAGRGAGPAMVREGSAIVFVGDVFMGAAQGIGDMVRGTVQLFVHPIATLKGLAMLPVTLVTRPGDLVRGFAEPYMEAISGGHSGRAIGRGIVEIGSIFFASKLVAKMGEVAHGAGKARSLAKIAGNAKKADVVTAVADESNKLAKLAISADKTGKVSAMTTIAHQGKKLAKVTTKSKRLPKLATTANLTDQAKVTTAIANKVGNPPSTITKKMTRMTKSGQLNKRIPAATPLQQALWHETKVTELSYSSRLMVSPGQDLVRVTRLRYQVVRQVQFAEPIKIIRVPLKRPPHKRPLGVAKPFANAAKKLTARAERLKAMGQVIESQRLSALATPLKSAGKLYAAGKREEALTMFRAALGKPGTLDALKLSNKAEEVWSAFGKGKTKLARN
ncbi:MAG: hypothetical protein HY692_05435 [Cyanobacteria bacterium NC_groundwater_1444_Ag_S-0.65um_54_12]|nr:hypothetical protein [Cyanobacteria bacterium NC_groundwater_1444_Ag_S-0.65um_54_12]